MIKRLAQVVIKKYLVIPRFIISSYDRDKHFIGSRQLISLYRVNPSECIICDNQETLEKRYRCLIYEVINLLKKQYDNYDLIPLLPNPSGNYCLKKEI